MTDAKPVSVEKQDEAWIEKYRAALGQTPARKSNFGELCAALKQKISGLFTPLFRGTQTRRRSAKTPDKTCAPQGSEVRAFTSTNGTTRIHEVLNGTNDEQQSHVRRKSSGKARTESRIRQESPDPSVEVCNKLVKRVCIAQKASPRGRKIEHN
jgi:hypothetical protein